MQAKILVKLADYSDQVINEGFSCYNDQLTSLEGSPKEVRGSFSCSDNKLTSLEGSPKEVGGDFYCHNNPGKFTKEDVRKVCNVNGVIYV